MQRLNIEQPTLIDKLKKIPFQGSSSSLIDYFFIIGFPDDFIYQYILKTETLYEPTILSVITSSSISPNFNTETLMRFVYPKTPRIIYNEQPQNSSAMFSNVFDTLEGKDKVQQIGYVYYFYERYNSNVFVPKCFVIISHFPFFATFKRICQDIYAYTTQTQNELGIPLDVVIYNIVNYIPSPLNASFEILLCDNPIPIKLPQLSGYPYCDFNLIELFNLLPVNLVVEIFFFSLFEPDMIFFCSNYEILNIIMYIISILNYPCCDSIYFWLICSVSKDEFIQPINSKFLIERFCTVMYGVNCVYSDDIKKIENAFVIDLNCKKITYKYDQSTNGSVNQKKRLKQLKINENYIVLQKYLHKIFRGKVKKHSKFLYTFITKLVNDIEHIINQYNNEYISKSTSILSRKNNTNAVSVDTANFFVMNEHISKTNRAIQEAFYNFYLNILTIFYQDNKLISCYDKFRDDDSKMHHYKSKTVKHTMNNNTLTHKDPFLIEYTANHNEFPEEEKIFCSFFSNTTKYSLYFRNFILEFRCLEMYRIPLMFSEEFINLKKNNVNIDKILFNTIDSFYMNYNDNTRIKKQRIDFNKFTMLFFNNKISIHIQPETHFKSIRLKKEVITKYISYLQNLNHEQLVTMFPSYKLILENEVQVINNFDIINCIETEMYKSKYIENKQLIYCSIFLLGVIQRKIYLFDEINTVFYIEMILSFTQKLQEELFDMKFPLIRKYMYLNLLMLYSFIQHAIENKLKSCYPNLYAYYFICVNTIRTYRILPNGQMMKLLSNINSMVKVMKLALASRTSIEESKTNECNDSSNNSNSQRYNIDYKRFSGVQTQLGVSVPHCSCGGDGKLFDIENYWKNAPIECDMESKCKNCEGKVIGKPIANISCVGNVRKNSFIFSPFKLKKVIEMLLFNECNEGNVKEYNEVKSNVFVNLFLFMKLILHNVKIETYLDKWFSDFLQDEQTNN